MTTTAKPSEVKRESPPREQIRYYEESSVRLSPLSKAKLDHCRDGYAEEIASYAISDPEDLLYIEDIWIPKQKVSAGSFDFDEESIADEMGHMFLNDLVRRIERKACHPLFHIFVKGYEESVFKSYPVLFLEFGLHLLALTQPKSGDPPLLILCL